MKDYSIKEFINKVLIGMSTGVIVTLVPPAIIGEIAKALNITSIVMISSLTMRLLGAIIGLCVAMQFKFSPLQVGTVAITSIIGSGAFIIKDGALILSGIGDVINTGITASLAVYLILLIGDKLKTYTILVLPTLVITLVGFIGMGLYPYVSSITKYIGEMVNVFTSLQPVLMGILIAITFSFLITSPISSVGVATAIGLSGISSGAANLGATAAGFGLAIAGYRVNGLGTSIAHIMGSPKLQMANLARKPKIILPVLALAAVLGGVAGYFKVQGDPISAGFGIIGFIGPLKHLNIVGWTTTNILLSILIFLILPFLFGIFMKYLFINKFKIIQTEDYHVDY